MPDATKPKLPTVAALKRALTIGRAVKITSFKAGGFESHHVSKNVTRYVVSSNSVGVEFGMQPTDATGSELQWPKASELRRLDERGFVIECEHIRLEYTWA